MALGFDSRIGLAGLVVGVIGIAIAILWPDKKWIGWLFLIVGAGILLYWGVIELRHSISSTRASLIISIAFGSLLGGVAAYLVWQSASSEREKPNPEGAKLQEKGDERHKKDATTSAIPTSAPPANRAASTPAKKLESIKIKLIGTKPIEIGSNGEATLPVMFEAIGSDETIHVQETYQPFAIGFSRMPTEKEELSFQEDTWAKFELSDKNGQRVTMSVLPNSPGIARIELGPDISTQMGALKEHSGRVYAAIRFRDPNGKILKDSFLYVDVNTNYMSLCAGHNVP